MNIALLLSGGIGTRMQSKIPKQYIRVKGKMIITYSLETLVNSPAIDEVHIVAEDEWKKIIIADAQKSGIAIKKVKGFAAPGRNRQASILNGLQNIRRVRNCQVDSEDVNKKDNVMIHDAVRPLLTQRMIADCFAKLCNHDGVMPVLQMKDTVYLSEDGHGVSNLINRKKIFAGQAPEVFNLKKYYQANINLTSDELDLINGSTEPAVLAGMDIVMIPGDENNFKITTQVDLERFYRISGDRREDI